MSYIKRRISNPDLALTNIMAIATSIAFFGFTSVLIGDVLSH